MVRTIYLFFIFSAWFISSADSDVVINELFYNPPDSGYESGVLREFVELYNPGSQPVDVSGYQFTQGIRYTIPEGTIVGADAYLVVACDPTYSSWRRKTIAILLGPYEGRLSDSGERITLARPDGTEVDSLRYDDFTPWPRTPDGYGTSLERIAWDLPSGDFHSWRSSLVNEGTPGGINTAVGTIPRPMILSHEIDPPHPVSSDTVRIRIGFSAAGIIDSATLQWERAERDSGSNTEQNFLVLGYDTFRYWKGISAPSEGLEWTQVGFDDSEWAQDEGAFGTGRNDFMSTRLTDMQGNYSTVYIRRRFNITNPDEYKSLFLYPFYKDGYVCYLNGTEVSSVNAPAELTHESLATEIHDSDNPDFVTIQNVDEILMEGENVLCLVGLNDELDDRTFLIGAFLQEGERNIPDVGTGNFVPMRKVAEIVESVTFEAEIPPNPSQTLVRFNAKVQLIDGRTVVLPHVAALRPFESYFVYDGEIESKLPVLWLYESIYTGLTEFDRSAGGAVALLPGESAPYVHDGAIVYPSRNGQKLKFLKGEEFRGDRTVNVIPEAPYGSTTAGTSSPHREHLGYWFFESFGVPVPRAEWFRVISTPRSGAVQTQQLIVQQVNERFLEMNGRNPDADLYKRNYVNPLWEKHTNLETGDQSITDLMQALQQARDPDTLHEVLFTNLVIDEFMAYEVASVLMSNWDGFHNNHWMYLDPDTLKWEIIPWDLDKVWGYTDTKSMFVEMPVEFPLNGRAAHASRSTGPVTGKFHQDDALHQQYIENLQYELSNSFTEEVMFAKIDEVEALLLEDLDLLEAQIGAPRADRREQILNAYNIIREFVVLRREYLIGEIGTPVVNWALY